MEIKNILILIFFLPTLLFCKEYEYEVSIFGIHCADIVINYKDTVYNNQDAIILEYQTKTKTSLEYFFFIDNNYTSIINKENYDLLSYTKKTKQPKLTNSIETYSKNDSLFYLNNHEYFNNNFYNIFSLLYSLQMNKKHTKSLNYIEREGNIYNMNIESITSNNQIKYTLFLDLNINKSKNSVYKNTDIFTWGVFLPNSKKEIIVDKKNKVITSCKFSTGLINVYAKLK